MSLYPYTEKNLLEEPEYYMYSVYGGTAFLGYFFKAREDIIKKLEEVHKNEIGKSLSYQNALNNLPDALSLDDSFELDLFLSKDTFKTEAVLKTILTVLLDPDNKTGEDKVYTWSSRLLKRFEVQKKLYSTYTLAMKRVGEDFEVLQNYALLALALVLYHQQSGNLKMLNTVLKLNDLLITQFLDLNTIEQTLLYCSLKMEQESINVLLEKKGVLLDT